MAGMMRTCGQTGQISICLLVRRMPKPVSGQHGKRDNHHKVVVPHVSVDGGRWSDRQDRFL